MSEHWEFFPCQMGDHVAMIFYDHGIRDEIDGLELEQQVRFDLTYRSPSANGLPTNEEFEAVKSVEDRIDAFSSRHGGRYVGRVTVAGHRYFISYLDVEPNELDDFLAEARRESGYELSVRVEHDPEKRGYWDDLFPTKEDWRVILDQRVMDALREAGDDLVESRRIDHWAYFENERDANAFVRWLEDNGFSRVEQDRTRDASSRICVQFHRADVPSLNRISRITIELDRRAQELDGEYDGWETRVVPGT